MAGIKSTEWFKDNVCENVQDIQKIGDTAVRRLVDVLSLDLVDNETMMSIYGNIFKAACEYVAGKEKDYDAYDLDIADFLHIGYTTTDSEDDEKTGNFMVYLQHKDNPSIDAIIDDEETNTLALSAIWNAMHIKVQAEEIKEVAIEGKKALDKYINLKTESHEFIIPVFCIAHAQLVRYLKNKRMELGLSEFEINVCGLFDAGCSVNDDAEEEIYFHPSIALKLLFKNDSIASSSGDDD